MSFRRQVHREADVVGAVEDQLPLGLVDETGARGRGDRPPGLAKIKAGAFRQHQRLGVGDEVDEGEHVGDHLDHRGGAQRTHVKELAADRLQGRFVLLEQRLVAAGEHRDLALGGKVDAAGHRCFQCLDAVLGGNLGEPQRLVATERRILDPGAALLQPGEQSVRAR